MDPTIVQLNVATFLIAIGGLISCCYMAACAMREEDFKSAIHGTLMLLQWGFILHQAIGAQ